MSSGTRILLVDSYDSFTLNLAALCRQAIPNCSIHIIKNDQLDLVQLVPCLHFFSVIVIGPGPGSPDVAQDIGIVKNLWKLSDECLVPIFGVCLGLQSLSIEFGAHLKRLNVVKHGQISHIHHRGTDIFNGVGTVHAVRYHSLHVELVTDGEIEELAWTDDGIDNGKVVMAVKHRNKPFWAVQYHPESVCTRGGGLEVLCNFWELAQSWAKRVGRKVASWDPSNNKLFGPSWPPVDDIVPSPSLPTHREYGQVLSRVLEAPNLASIEICDMLGARKESSPFVLLESASQPGRFSIVASLMPTSPRITYFTGDSFVTLRTTGASECVELGSKDIWSWLTGFMLSRRVRQGPSEIPFWGGLVGYLSYEVGVDSLPIPVKAKSPDYPRHADVNLVFVERSVVLDSVTGKVFIQSILPNDGDWVAATRLKLKRASLPRRGLVSDDMVASKRRKTILAKPLVTLPNKDLYISRIKRAKERLSAGDSYELCLTAHTYVTVPHAPSFNHDEPSSWDLYKTLRTNNPAPHSAYLRLGPTTLLSSSPERFLSFSRPPNATCQLRPIKGTVRKSLFTTRATAEKALAGSKKEVAENLMIVDLIRHDLHSVVGEDVQVRQFCSVEEYETVWQLVSVIEGRLPSSSDTGWEVLQRSLPPGSMTGAPKKRSVEILRNLEDGHRSIYSGIFGYWCVGGGGDWSVTIRSCFKYDKRFDVDPEGREGGGPTTASDEWVIGAGGAITALSEPEAEWDEMLVKLQSVLRAFGVTVPLEA